MIYHVPIYQTRLPWIKKTQKKHEDLEVITSFRDKITGLSQGRCTYTRLPENGNHEGKKNKQTPVSHTHAQKNKIHSLSLNSNLGDIKVNKDVRHDYYYNLIIISSIFSRQTYNKKQPTPASQCTGR